MKERERDGGLDLLKTAATVLIVLHHYQQVFWVRFDRGINFYGGTFYFGYLVELFFVISGFVMYDYIARIREGLRFRPFISRRYSRLFPMMLVTAAAFALIAAAYEAKLHFPWPGVQLDLWGIIVASLGIQGGWGLPNPGINNPTWYLSVLLLCYVLFYACVRLAKRKDLPLTAVFLFLIFLGIGIMNYDIDLPFLNAMTARGYCAFFWGLILAGLLRRREPGRPLRLLSLAVVLGFPFAVAYANGFVSSGISFLLTFVYYPAWIVVLRAPAAKKLLRAGFWKTLGSISFNVYMWHSFLFIVFDLYMCTFGWDISYSDRAVMLGFAVVCYLFGTVSHYCIEKPLTRFLERRFPRLAGQASV